MRRTRIICAIASLMLIGCGESEQDKKTKLMESQRAQYEKLGKIQRDAEKSAKEEEAKYKEKAK